MRNTLIMIAGALSLVGCAQMRAEETTDRRVAQLPVEARKDVIAQQQKIDVAKANVKTAEVSVDQARQFRQAARDEEKAAEAQQRAADRGVGLAQTNAYDPQARERALEARAGAQAQVDTAKAKVEYADKMLDFQQAKHDEAQAQLDLQRAVAREDQLTTLDRYGMSQGIDRGVIIRARSDAQNELVRAQQRVAQARGLMAQAQQAWQSRPSVQANIGGITPPRAPQPLPQAQPQPQALPQAQPQPLPQAQPQPLPQDNNNNNLEEGAGTTP